MSMPKSKNLFYKRLLLLECDFVKYIILYTMLRMS